MLCTGFVAAVVGAGLAACTTDRTEAKAQRAAPTSVAVPPEDTTGIVAGHCAQAAPAPSRPAGSLPPSPSGSASTSYPPPAATVPMVPIVASTVVLCLYNGMNDAPYRGLRRAKVITDGAFVERWRGRFNRLRPLTTRPRACPAADGSLLRIAFVGSPRSYVVLSAALTGCPLVTSGVEQRDLYDAADWHVRDDLVRLASG
jgi:hypothetical protein